MAIRGNHIGCRLKHFLLSVDFRQRWLGLRQGFFQIYLGWLGVQARRPNPRKIVFRGFNGLTYRHPAFFCSGGTPEERQRTVDGFLDITGLDQHFVSTRSKLFIPGRQTN